MTTYVLMGLPFIATTLFLDLFLLKTKVVRRRKTYKLMGGLLLLTAIFNQVLTGVPIVTYEQDKILGIKLFYMPIEDFLYTIAVVILVGSLSEYQKRKSSG